MFSPAANFWRNFSPQSMKKIGKCSPKTEQNENQVSLLVIISSINCSFISEILVNLPQVADGLKSYLIIFSILLVVIGDTDLLLPTTSYLEEVTIILIDYCNYYKVLNFFSIRLSLLVSVFVKKFTDIVKARWTKFIYHRFKAK